ncbi:MAG: DUF4097 domain-containing protein [Cyclobacteriaceae bacterium]|nr:DUF4097 domain-containing protein [Cyclobacteriaceae bacterium]
MNSILQLILILTLTSMTAFAQKNSDIDIDKKYEVNQNGTLHLKSDDADVRITGTDRKDAHVKIHRRVDELGIVMGERDFKVEVTIRDGDLYIEDFEQSSTLSIVGYIEEEYTITIEIPQTMSLKIRGDDDDYVIRNVNGEIRMKVDDGDARLRNCRGKYFDFDFDDGDINMDVASGYLKLDIDDGDFEVEQASFTEIDANIDDGDIDMKTSLGNDSSYTFIVDDGTIDLSILSGGGEFTIYHDDTSISTMGRFIKTQDDESKSTLSLNEGTAKVKIRSDDGRIRLKAI